MVRFLVTILIMNCLMAYESTVFKVHYPEDLSMILEYTYSAIYFVAWLVGLRLGVSDQQFNYKEDNLYS